MSRAEVLEAPVPIIDGADEQMAGYEYQRADGTVERAMNAEEAIARCPVLGQLAIESPDEAEALLELAAAGQAQIEAGAAMKREKPPAPDEKVLSEPEPETKVLEESFIRPKPAPEAKREPVIADVESPAIEPRAAVTPIDIAVIHQSELMRQQAVQEEYAPDDSLIPEEAGLDTEPSIVKIDKDPRDSVMVEIETKDVVKDEVENTVVDEVEDRPAGPQTFDRQPVAEATVPEAIEPDEIDKAPELPENANLSDDLKASRKDPAIAELESLPLAVEETGGQDSPILEVVVQQSDIAIDKETLAEPNTQAIDITTELDEEIEPAIVPDTLEIDFETLVQRSEETDISFLEAVDADEDNLPVDTGGQKIVALAEQIESLDEEEAQTARVLLDQISEKIEEVTGITDVASAAHLEKDKAVEIKEEIKELFIELLDTAVSEYSEDLIDSFVNIALNGELADLIVETDDTEEENTPHDRGTHEIINYLLTGIVQIKHAVVHPYYLGKSAMQLYYRKLNGEVVAC